jgi:nucleoside-diphosphate-sugar epimerase
MKALVLGGSVFVGKHMVQALVDAGHDVSVLNRGKTPSSLPPAVKQIVADRTDAKSMRDALAGSQWDAVFDVSGFVMVSGGADAQSLLDLFDGNIGHYVYTSSVMAYDQGRGVFPWREEDPMSTEGPETYGGFKAEMERQLLARYQKTGFPATIIRPAAIYGPDNNIFDMELPMFLRLRQGRPILVPHGGLVAVSYGHVDDLCEAMLGCVGNKAGLGEIFNITAEAVTANEYVRVLAEIVGAKPNIVPVPDDMLPALNKPAFGHLFSSVHHGPLSIEKAQRRLGFQPKYDLHSGHRDTYAWFLAQGWGDKDVSPLIDTLWGATWDFDYEADTARRIAAAKPRFA